MPSTVFDSTIFRDAFGTPAMRAVFCDEALDRGATSRSRWRSPRPRPARRDPQDAAATRSSRPARADAIDLAKLKAETDLVGYPIVGLVHQLAKQCGEAGRYVHWGATTQDIMDTATVLQIRDGAGAGRGRPRGARRGAGRARRASIATR